MRDLLDKYPQVTGFRPDWPEYPCYKLDEAFQDFGPHVRTWAARHGFDFEGIRAGVGALYNHLRSGLHAERLNNHIHARECTANVGRHSCVSREPL